MMFSREQKEKNSIITRQPSRSDILTLLTLLSADEKSAVVQPLTKVEVRNFS